ncbi:MAG: DUF6789 family protein [Rhodospirillaceae bacterium]
MVIRSQKNEIRIVESPYCRAPRIAFALLYAMVFAQFLPGEPYVKGLIFGGIVYVGAMFIFVPFFLKDGFFESKGHPMGSLTALIIHLIYCLILGWLSPIL